MPLRPMCNSLTSPSDRVTIFTPAKRIRLQLAGLPCLTGDNSRQFVTAIFRLATPISGSSSVHWLQSENRGTFDDAVNSTPTIKFDCLPCGPLPLCAAHGPGGPYGGADDEG